MSHDRGIDEEVAQGTQGPPVKLILALLVAVALAIFFFQNTRRTHIQFLWIDVNWPIWAVIGISAVGGALLMRLVGWMWSRRGRE